jgi:hypothetical protein
MHEIEFVDQAVAFQQIEGAVDGDPIDVGVDFAGAAQDLAGVQMLLSGLDHAQNGAPLMGHAQSARHEFCLQASGRFGLG